MAKMSNNYFKELPSEMLGNAGTGLPGEKEIRYSPYMERIRLRSAQGGCEDG